MTKRVSPSCPPHDARNLRDKHPELKQKISELQNEINQLQQGHSNAESNLKALTVLFAVKMRARLKVHSFITICAVPLSQPFPIKNYFKNRLSSENTVFPRTSAYCRSEKKNGVGRGKLANKFFMGNIKGPRTPGG